MYVRAIALALPLVLGIAACKTSSSQKSGQTASTETSPGSGQTGAGATASGAYGGAGAASGSSDVTAHAGDQTVTGKVTRISEGSVAIKSDLGEEKTLELVPQTTVKVDGQDASRVDLKEGQEVRASYNQVDGRDVAVQIEARQSAGPTGSSDTGTGTSGSMQGGATGTGSTGSTGMGDTGTTGTGSGTGTTTPPPDTK